MATVSDNDPKARLQSPATKAPRDRRAAQTQPTPDRIAAESASIYPDTFDTAPSPEEIAAEAYLIYQARGGEHGRDQDDWLEAERRLAERRTK